jgi:hypothetical protein
MNAAVLQYVQSLKAELDQLYREMEQAAQRCAERRQKDEITEHVYFENEALIGGEEYCIKAFIRILDEVQPERHADVEELVEHLAGRFEAHVMLSGCAPCTLIFVRQRMLAVRRRLLGEQAP